MQHEESLESARLRVAVKYLLDKLSHENSRYFMYEILARVDEITANPELTESWAQEMGFIEVEK